MRHIVFGAVPLLGMALSAGAATSFLFEASELYVDVSGLAGPFGAASGSVTFQQSFGADPGVGDSDLAFSLFGPNSDFFVLTDGGFTLSVGLTVVAGQITDGLISIGIPNGGTDTYIADIDPSAFDSFVYLPGTFVGATGFTISGDFILVDDGLFNGVDIEEFEDMNGTIAGTFAELEATLSDGNNTGTFEHFAAIPLPTPVLLAAAPVMGIVAMRRRALT